MKTILTELYNPFIIQATLNTYLNTPKSSMPKVPKYLVFITLLLLTMCYSFRDQRLHTGLRSHEAQACYNQSQKGESVCRHIISSGRKA